MCGYVVTCVVNGSDGNSRKKSECWRRGLRPRSCRRPGCSGSEVKVLGQPGDDHHRCVVGFARKRIEEAKSAPLQESWLQRRLQHKGGRGRVVGVAEIFPYDRVLAVCAML